MSDTVKLSYDLGKVSDGVKLMFHLLLTNSEYEYNGKINQFKYHNEYTVNGTDFYKLSFHPFITIDIGWYFKEDAKNPLHVLSLTNINRIKFCRALQRILNGFTNPDLFRYNRNGRLYINQEIAEQYNQRNLVLSNKICELVYIVDTKHDNEVVRDIESVVFVFNNVDNFCILTEEDVTELLSVLNSVNYHMLAMSLYTYYITVKDNKDFNPTKISYVQPYEVERVQEELSSPIIPRIKSNNLPI